MPINKIKFLLYFLLAELLIIVLFCSPNRSIPDENAPMLGMRRIYSAGESFLQGANDSAANADEKPPMTSSFTYDFWIDTTPVTQKEYYDITGKQPVQDTSSYGKGNDYPVYYVSWFDAILFCNAKSKKDKLDTVYSYSGAPQIQQGSVYNLVDVHNHYERNGIRLPTESEWEFAAREGTSSLPFPNLLNTFQTQSYAWYSTNSSNRTHPVASLSPNAFGLYDMAGNVFEWTGDWKGFYCVSQITNSIGAMHPDNSNERVIKGGSFKTGFVTLRPSHRSAVYETSQSSIAEYVGFRCARGVIPSPKYISKDTMQIETNPMFLVTSNSRPFLGTNKARIVFVNVTKDLRTLCYVNFGNSYPEVYECYNFTSVYVPAISPNGKYVAFCTRNEGFDGKAAIYVGSLDSLDKPPTKIPSDSAFEPRWWVDPGSQDTFCIFTNSAINNATSLWPSTSTFMMKVAGGSPVGAIQPLVTIGSFHDGRSQNGRFLVTGFTQLIMHDMETAIDRQLFLSPQNGKKSSGSTQVCNASICPDPLYNDRCLFIDFGCPPPMKSTLTGTSYGVHEYLFIEEYSGAVLSWYRCPEGEASWDYPEWSSVSRFAVASARNEQDNAHAIYLVDLLYSNYCKVIEGVELAQPFLWVNIPNFIAQDSLALDSLGYYNDPPLNVATGQFAQRMQDFWRKHDDIRIAFVGSSHTANAIDPNFFTGTTVCNMAIEGGNHSLAITILKNYIFNHCPSIQLIGCDIIPGYMQYPGLFTATQYFLLSNKGYNYDKNHQFWTFGLPKNFGNLAQLAPSPFEPRMDTLGLIKTYCKNWEGGANLWIPDAAELKWTIDDTDCMSNFNDIKDIARMLANKKIHFLMYTTPESPYYQTTGFYGVYGGSFETGKAITSQFKALEDSIPAYFHFYNGNEDGYHDFADSEAADAGHLCYIGAKRFSARMDSVVHSILGH
jgi:uncharacterized protein (TIGR02171 family)